MTKASVALAALLCLSTVQPATGQRIVVRGVLFFSPTCPHCRHLMAETLPPILERYGPRLEIVRIDASTEEGYGLYEATIEHFNLPQSRRGVPLLVVGNDVLLGGTEIPSILPLLVDRGLAAGGIDWPAVDGMREAVEKREGGGDPEDPEEADGEVPASMAPVGVTERFLQDPTGNSVAIVVLLGLLAILWRVGGTVLASKRLPTALRWPSWTLPVLTLLGMGVAAYLTYIERTGVEAVCGPVGDCNTVQQSAYAHLMGTVPVAFLGLAGYAAMLGTWLVAVKGSERTRRWGFRSLWLLALIGTCFSAYLTGLEPLVIGASCAWCLTSAVISGMILVAATPTPAPSRSRLKRA